ncbi:MAG: BrnT family toxin [Verrucomicrobiales bacterium]|jgi:uncharacterized DUF497 family protein|nr:BrnT family toxin [Verrucomicrobiales bacterium]
MNFEWDENKDRFNQAKHGISFEKGKQAFYDPKARVWEDVKHSTSQETRYFAPAWLREKF